QAAGDGAEGGQGVDPAQNEFDASRAGGIGLGGKLRLGVVGGCRGHRLSSRIPPALGGEAGASPARKLLCYSLSVASAVIPRSSVILSSRSSMRKGFLRNASPPALSSDLISCSLMTPLTKMMAVSRVAGFSF